MIGFISFTGGCGALVGVLLAVWVRSVLRRRQLERLFLEVTSPGRGNSSEHSLIMMLLRMGVPPWALFHDLYVEKEPGVYAQIDAVVVSKAGIVVIEVKDYAGRISGRGDEFRWNRKFVGGREIHTFYNPVMQNAGHIAALRRRLRACRGEWGSVPCHSVVVFFGDNRLRIRGLRDDVAVIRFRRLKKTIRRIVSDNPPADYSDLRGICAVLSHCVEAGADEEVVKKHISNVRALRSDLAERGARHRRLTCLRRVAVVIAVLLSLLALAVFCLILR